MCYRKKNNSRPDSFKLNNPNKYLCYFFKKRGFSKNKSYTDKNASTKNLVSVSNIIIFNYSLQVRLQQLADLGLPLASFDSLPTLAPAAFEVVWAAWKKLGELKYVFSLSKQCLFCINFLAITIAIFCMIKSIIRNYIISIMFKVYHFL